MARAANILKDGGYLTKRLIAGFGNLMACTLCAICINNAYGYNFHWGYQGDTGEPGVVPVPHVGNGLAGDEWPSLYDDQAAGNDVIALMMRVANSPFAPGNIYGKQSPGVLQEVLDYIDDNGQYLDYVFADYECTDGQVSAGDCSKQHIMDALNMTIDMVRSSANPNINSAYIGQYDFYPGDFDRSELWGNYERQQADADYRNSGLNIAMPSLYPYTAYRNHHARPDRHGDLAVSLEHALFWTPLERYSTAKRALPAGHLMIPWVGGLVNNPGYEAPMPSREDVRGLVQHIRLRGADGYYTWSHGANTNYSSSHELRADIYDNAWQPLDWFFQLEGESRLLNLGTNKTGGVEWSGMQRGNRVLMVYSNYTDSEARVDLGHLGIPDLPDQSPAVAPNSHLLRDYTIGPQAQWELNEGQGGITRDTSNSSSSGGAGLTQGEVFGAEWVTGVVGQALRFNGAASVDFGDIYDLGTSDRTISLWFKTSQYDGSSALLSKGHRLGENAHAIFVRKGRLRARTSIAGRRYTVTSANRIDDDQWHHVVVVMDRDDRMQMFLDGVAQAAVNISAGEASDVQNSDSLTMGRTGRGNFFEGDIDTLRIYDHALDAEAILDDYSARMIARLDSTSGNQVRDSSISNLSASTACDTWSAGKQGGSLAFRYGCGVNFGDVLDLGVEDRTISLWFRTVTTGAYETLLSKGHSVTFNNHAIFMWSDGRVFSLMDVNGTDRIVRSTGAPLNDGEWHHLVLTMDRGGMMSMYVDNALMGSVDISGDVDIDGDNTHPLYLGRTPQGHHFNGDLDEVKIYNRVLTEAERVLAGGKGW